MDFVDIASFAMHSKTNTPFANIYMKNMRIKWERDPSYNITIFIEGSEMRTTYFEWNEDKLIERGFLGALDKQIEYETEKSKIKKLKFDLNEEFFDSFIDEMGQVDAFSLFEIPYFEEKNMELRAKVFINTKGDKNVKVLLSNLKIMMQTSAYLNLFYFTQLDYSVYPPMDESNK